MAQDNLTIFLGERLDDRRKDVEHDFRGTAKPCTTWCDYKGTIDQDGILQHGINDDVIGDAGLAQPQIDERSSFLTQGFAWFEHGFIDEPNQLFATRWCCEIFDHCRLDTGMADQGQRIARSAAIRVVIDRCGHWCHRTHHQQAPLAQQLVLTDSTTTGGAATSVTPAATDKACASAAPLRSL